MLSDIADSMNITLLCHSYLGRSLILLSSRFPIFRGVTTSKHDFGLGRKEVLLFDALSIRMNDFAVLNLVSVALLGLR